ncbi:MAG TPA: N-acetylmuramoyl-L-alanine amidase [Bryobacteraceae bacterium]|jgi:N-acetylmuramoyl-L-alanine amidase|nr:N-acetylmuramoyl-L-alanine amidase [Bryobacteraceae bacterium]
MGRRFTRAIGFLVVTMAAVGARAASSPEVTAVRYWTLSDTTRVAIEVTSEVHYRADRAQNPERIFFDLSGTRPSIDGHRLFSAEVGDKRLKRIRVAETVPGTTRVVLDLESPAEFTVSRLDNPSRMIIELRPAGGTPEMFARKPDREAAPAQREPEPMRDIPRHAAAPAPTISDPPSLKADVVRPQVARMAAKTVTTSVVVLPAPLPSVSPAAAPSKSQLDDAAPAMSASRIAPPRVVPKPARESTDGETSLTRALGLKINRVVIDPGHGGADEGTVGRRGVMEKELVLDVARRLGKLIEERMGSEVIYTRSDDTFIPLHARTEMANEKKADLFLSIHANSSPHPKIGGIEVYYLNFTRSSDALDVAARENASSEKSVFELKDLIQSITLHEKVEESREFASKVQGSLQTFETRYNAAAKNRGIKKAPFVVLIGASMPSILAEIGFLSNAREEQLLKRPDHRQRLAEALYQGVSRYAQSLSHFQVAQRASVD